MAQRTEDESHESETQRPSWSVLAGEFDPDTTLLDSSRLDALGVHIRNSGETVNVYMTVLYALEVSNPNVMRDEVQRVLVENDLIDTINILNADEYTSDKLDELRSRVPEFETAALPVIEALKAIFKALEAKEKDIAAGIKAKAYNNIRALYLIQSNQADKLPVDFK